MGQRMKRLLFPSLSDGAAPVSYELGVALLLAWVGHILHGVSDVATRYPSSYWIWQFIDDNDLEKIIPWYALAGSFCICLGLMRVACGCSRGHYLRASGLIIGSSVFAIVAFGHTP